MDASETRLNERVQKMHGLNLSKGGCFNMDSARLEKARRKIAEMKENGEAWTVEHNWIKKAKLNPASRIIAIKAMCFQCMGGTETELPDPGWKKSIRECSSASCPLHGHRPYREKP